MNFQSQDISRQTVQKKWLHVGTYRDKRIEQLVFMPPRPAAAVAAERAVREATVSRLRSQPIGTRQSSIGNSP